MCGHKSRVHVLAVALAAGIVWALVVLVLGLTGTLVPGHMVIFDLFGAVYAGFTPTAGGVVVGIIWGFIYGFIAGLIFALLYNAFSHCCRHKCGMCCKMCGKHLCEKCCGQSHESCCTKTEKMETKGVESPEVKM